MYVFNNNFYIFAVCVEDFIKQNMVKITRIALAVVLLFGPMFVSCNKSTGEKQDGQIDTLSYIVGLNVGYNLIKMDSTLNVESVCQAIRDIYEGKPKMSMSDARDFYLAEQTFFIHERAKAYQEQFLVDLSKNNRLYKRVTKNNSNSGSYTSVAYNMIRLGNQERSSRSLKTRDTVTMVYTLKNQSGKELVKSDTLRDDYRNILKGLQDVVKIGRDGAIFNAWVASEAAYGTAGNKELGVGPNELLNYEVEIIEIKYNDPNKNKKK